MKKTGHVLIDRINELIEAYKNSKRCEDVRPILNEFTAIVEKRCKEYKALLEKYDMDKPMINTVYRYTFKPLEFSDDTNVITIEESLKPRTIWRIRIAGENDELSAAWFKNDFMKNKESEILRYKHRHATSQIKQNLEEIDKIQKRNIKLQEEADYYGNKLEEFLKNI